MKPEIKIQHGLVQIHGINGRKLLHDIARVHRSSRFVQNVFREIRGIWMFNRGVEFPEFFLPDVFHVMQQLATTEVRIQSKSIAARVSAAILDQTWLGQIDHVVDTRVDLSKLKQLTYTPMGHQMDFFQHYRTKVRSMHLNGTLLAANVGTGKTYMGLALSHCLDADRIIVICPLPAVQRVWEDQILKVFRQSQTYWISTSRVPFKGQRIAVYHYEALPKALDDVHALAAARAVIILDECHNLNEPKSARTRAFLSLVAALKSKDVILASGSPIKAESYEIGTLLKAIDPMFTADVEEMFKRAYAGTSKERAEIIKSRLGQISFQVTSAVTALAAPTAIDLPVQIPNGDQYTLKVLKTKMQAYIIERTQYYETRSKADHAFYAACLDHYARTIQHDAPAQEQLALYRVYIEDIQHAYATKRLGDVSAQMEFCNRFETQQIIPSLLAADRPTFKETKTIIKYVGLKIQGECLGRVLGRFRIQCHVDMVPHIDFASIIDDAEAKTIVFTTYTEVCTAVTDVVTASGYRPVQVYGPHTKNLSASVSTFERTVEANPLVATYASLSTAVPLIMANTIIMINTPFRSYIQEQSIGRVHRLGQVCPVFIYTCLLDTGTEPNISTRGIDILAWSQTQVEQLTGVENIFKAQTTVNDDGGYTIANESIGYHEHYIDPSTLPVISKWGST